MCDHEEFLKVYLAAEPDLRAFVRTLVRDRSDFEDVTQSIALVLWRKFSQYDRTRSFGAWARGVAANEILAIRRESKRAPVPFSPAVVAAILDSFEQSVAGRAPISSRLDALQLCLDELPPNSRQMIDLRYGASLSIAQVADEADRTVAGTQKALSRIRLRLADCILRRLASEGER